MPEEKKPSPKTTPSLFIGIGLAVLAVLLIIFFRQAPIKESQVPKEGQIPTAPSSVDITPGKTGELGLKEGQSPEEALKKVNPEALEKPLRPADTPIPPVIFHTRGTILEVREDFLLLGGDGSNFEDQKSRNLKVKLTDATITFEKGYTKQYQGLESLKHLKKDERILIEAPENIKGKSEFTAIYINKL